MSFENPNQFDQNIDQDKIESVEEMSLENMSFEDFENLPHSHPFFSVFQKQMLEYLKTEDTEWFEGKYNGDTDDEGYLFLKDGTNSNSLPSQNTSSQNAMRKVVQMTKDILSKESNSQ